MRTAKRIGVVSDYRLLRSLLRPHQVRSLLHRRIRRLVPPKIGHSAPCAPSPREKERAARPYCGSRVHHGKLARERREAPGRYKDEHGDWKGAPPTSYRPSDEASARRSVKTLEAASHAKSSFYKRTCGERKDQLRSPATPSVGWPESSSGSPARAMTMPPWSRVCVHATQNPGLAAAGNGDASCPPAEWFVSVQPAMSQSPMAAAPSHEIRAPPAIERVYCWDAHSKYPKSLRPQRGIRRSSRPCENDSERCRIQQRRGFERCHAWSRAAKP